MIHTEIGNNLAPLPIEYPAVLNKTYTIGFGILSEQHIFMFPNGYGASVVRNEYSYGGSEGLYELAVLERVKIDGNQFYGSFTYDTDITDNVIGWLSVSEIANLLIRISHLDNLDTAQPTD